MRFRVFGIYPLEQPSFSTHIMEVKYDGEAKHPDYHGHGGHE
jgi:hypothetical protein